MTTPPTDTRAALDDVLAAIDADTHEGRAVSLSDHAGLKSAISAHVAANVAACNAGWQARDASNDEARVAAEVARALACAPGVEDAIDAYANAGRSGVTTPKDLEDVRAAWQSALAAIAADRARAVAEARPTPDDARRLVEAHHLDLLSIADTVASLHGATGPGLRGHCVAQADKLRLAAGTARTALLRALGVES